MSAKGCLFVGETFLWLLAFICRVFLTNAATDGTAGPSSDVARQRPDHDPMVGISKPNSTTRVLTQCQVICQGSFCWDLCGRTAETSKRHEEKIYPRLRRRAPNIEASRYTSYVSPTNAAAVEEFASGSGGGTESTSSVRGDVSGEPFSNSGSPTVESTSVGSSARGSSGAAVVSINMTVVVSNETSSELYAELYFRLTSRLNWSNGTIRVHLASETCNLNRSFPYCGEPNRHQDYKILADSNKWMKYRFPGFLMFNAKYWTKIDAGQDSTDKYYFKTEGCSRWDKENPRKCLLPLGFLPVPAPPDPRLLIKVRCINYDLKDETVSIDLQWRVDTPPNVRWNSSILVFLMPDKNPMLTKMIDRLETRLTNLMVNHVYEILISAKSEKFEIIYVPLIFNASVERLKKARQICPTGPPTTYPRIDPVTRSVDENSKDAVLIGSLIFVSLSMAGVVFFVYRKCNGERNSKTAISRPKGNSCKSSPSGSLRPLRDRQPFNPTVDEWEIDPREVSLGVEIGQGAFGRVLTGYYRDKEIAIKVLRENIPEFYREDLLREIYLMKGLGYHPNIVTMLGACTIREPIALIVEYMPFGNLQTFLKKCRVDRETLTPNKRSEMLYCLLDEMTGVKESWQIAPTDILSFARQVVLAMQYLAERHYVHRDLAARNILLGNNKVVKVCDFGLARMVYTGEQYFKLTSGRLPLKWMALESIRDRVFTTHSDVWSFGVLLWEMVTLGASPYPGIALVDLYRLLAGGYRMQQPVNCSDELYDIISQCWCENPTDRPTFARIRNQLETLLARNVDYLDLDNIDIPLNHSEKDDDGDNNADVKDRLLTAHDNVCIC